MSNKETIDKIMGDMQSSTSTMQTDVGFRFTINKLLCFAAMVRAQVNDADPTPDYIYTALSIKSCLNSLQLLLHNEIKASKTFTPAIKRLDRLESEYPGFPEYAKGKVNEYNLSQYLKGGHDKEAQALKHAWQRKRSEYLIYLLDFRFKEIMQLMKDNNLLLQEESDIDA